MKDYDPRSSAPAKAPREDLGPALDWIRAHVSLYELASGRVSWDQKKSVPRRRDWWACCPFHGEKTPSFHVLDAKGRYHCFGCGASGDAVTWAMHFENLSFPDAVKRLASGAGLAAETPAERAEREARARAAQAKAEAEAARDEAERRADAAALWQTCAPSDDTLVEEYLAARAIDVAALKCRFGGNMPVNCRFHSGLDYLHKSDTGWRRAGCWPAMVWQIQDGEGKGCGVHVTWLDPLHPGNKAPVPKGCKSKKVYGRQKGAAIRFGPASRRMMAGEGIETTLSAWLSPIKSGLSLEWCMETGGTTVSAWCAINLGNMAGPGNQRFAGPRSAVTGLMRPSAVPDWKSPGFAGAGLSLPDEVEEFLVLGDGSKKDPKSVMRLNLRAKRRQERKASGARRLCDLAVAAGDPALGLDFNDVLMAQIASGKPRDVAPDNSADKE